MGIALRGLVLHHVRVPLRSKIAHASQERTSSDNLVVRAELSDGTAGYGEGVPRVYVTGETIETTFETLKRFDAACALGTCHDFAEVCGRLEQLELPERLADPRGMAGNAARCALELALLDAYGRHFRESMGTAVRRTVSAARWVSPAPHPVRYSGAITAASERRERISAWKMKIYGFEKVKVKVGVSGQDDAARLARLRRILGRRIDIRIDANEAWTAREVVDRLVPLRPFAISAVEQPVPHAQVSELAEIRPGLGVPVMLDESLCGWPDGVRAVEERLADMFNVRLSKCGGIFPSLRLMDLAWRAGLGVQLGCHPGETGILSAAGRHLATNLNGVRYLEGSYDRHVLGRNLIREDITFGYGGRARPLTGPGLGVTVDEDLVEALCQRREEVCYG